MRSEPTARAPCGDVASACVAAGAENARLGGGGLLLDRLKSVNLLGRTVKLSFFGATRRMMGKGLRRVTLVADKRDRKPIARRAIWASAA